MTRRRSALWVVLAGVAAAAVAVVVFAGAVARETKRIDERAARLRQATPADAGGPVVATPRAANGLT